MENFFINKPNNLKSQYSELQNNYEKIFIEAAESIRRELDKLKPENACSKCSIKNCKLEKKDIFSNYPDGCTYREWQFNSLNYLSSDYKIKLKQNYSEIMNKKQNYKCEMCGACCELAASEYSYQQLKQKANKGDKFSEEFVSIFKPFEDEKEAESKNPEYFKLLNELVTDDKIYYYYCPNLINNKCSIYENRPNICRDFPHNPLKLLPSTCSFNNWKNEVSHQAMLLKAKIDIIDYYKGNIQ